MRDAVLEKGGMQPAQTLPQIEKRVTQEQIKRYAQASGDFNPVHLDPEFASHSSFGRIVAHGMLVLAFLSEMMTLAFGVEWLKRGHLKVRFKAPAYPGDVITTFGELKAPKDGSIRYDVGCRNQHGDEVIVGEAWVELPGEGM